MRASVSMSLIAAFLIVGIDLVNALEVPEVHYPTLARYAPTSEGFIPQGWKVETQSVGDLNGDGLSDYLLVLRQDDPANIIANDPDSLGVQRLDTNPRILAVVFARKRDGYELALENHDFIPRNETPTLDDPFGQADIVDGALQVSLHYWANAGSWYTDDATFIFRYRDNALRLVGYKDFTTKRNTGETWDLSVDFLAHEAKITLGNYSDDESENKTYRKSVPESPLPTIEELGSGWDFQPEEANLSWWGLGESEN